MYFMKIPGILLMTHQTVIVIYLILSINPLHTPWLITVKFKCKIEFVNVDLYFIPVALTTSRRLRPHAYSQTIIS